MHHNGSNDKLQAKRAKSADQIAFICGEETWFYDWLGRDGYRPAILYHQAPAGVGFFHVFLTPIYDARDGIVPSTAVTLKITREELPAWFTLDRLETVTEGYPLLDETKKRLLNDELLQLFGPDEIEELHAVLGHRYDITAKQACCFGRTECIGPDLLVDVPALAHAPKITWADFDEEEQAKLSFRIKIAA